MRACAMLQRPDTFPRSYPADPFAGLSKKKIWFDCVWHSTEPPVMKLFLICIGRFFDNDGRASSMALSQIVRDCGFSEDTARRCLKQAREYWLEVGVQQGFWTRWGRQNSYDAAFPPQVLEGLREYRIEQASKGGAHSKGG